MEEPHPYRADEQARSRRALSRLGHGPPLVVFQATADAHYLYLCVFSGFQDSLENGRINLSQDETF